MFSDWQLRRFAFLRGGTKAKAGRTTVEGIQGSPSVRLSYPVSQSLFLDSLARVDCPPLAAHCPSSRIASERCPAGHDEFMNGARQLGKRQTARHGQLGALSIRIVCLDCRLGFIRFTPAILYSRVFEQILSSPLVIHSAHLKCKWGPSKDRVMRSLGVRKKEVCSSIIGV